MANTSPWRDLSSLGKEFAWVTLQQNVLGLVGAVQGSAAPVHEFIFWEGPSSHVRVIKDVLGIL